MSAEVTRRQGIRGYGLLVGLVVLGGVSAVGLGGLGLVAYFEAAGRSVKTAREGNALLGSLETALALWSFGILGLLVAVTALVVIVKGLSDDVAAARRGPVERR